MKLISVPAESLRLMVRVLDGYGSPTEERNFAHALDNMRISFTEEELAHGSQIDEKASRPAILQWREEPEWFG